MEGETDIYKLSRRDIVKTQLYTQSSVQSTNSSTMCALHAVVGVGAMIYCKKCRDGDFIEYEETLTSKSSNFINFSKSILCTTS